MILKAIKKLTFTGGIHPPDKKELTAESPIQQGPMPKQIAVMLSQHIGAVCEPLVRKNDQVQAGQLIGKANAFVSAPVHSPVNGKVKEISLQSHPVLGRCMAVVIEPDDTNTPRQFPTDLPADFDITGYSPEQIVDAVADGGVVGMGGAGFPTVVKIKPNPKSKNKTLIINACECEPYITCDYRLMLENPGRVLTGIRLAQKASGCSEVFIGIEDNKPKDIETLQQTIDKAGLNEQIIIVPLETKYPQGGERQLIQSVMRKTVPTGAIPPMIAVVVLNVSTAAAISDAVIDKKPLTHRVVTVSGEGINKPANYYVPVGTPIADLIELSGGLKDKAAKVVSGGPMMGFAVADLTTPLTKTSGAITVLTPDQIGKAKSRGVQTPCIRCGRCVQVCPEKLNPTKIAHAVQHENLDLAKDYFMSACMECGSCSFVCPANIELTGMIKTGKTLVARQNKKLPE